MQRRSSLSASGGPVQKTSEEAAVAAKVRRSAAGWRCWRGRFLQTAANCSSLGLWPSLKIISCIIVLFSAKDSARLRDGGVNRSKATLISVMTNMMFAAAMRPINTVMHIYFYGSDGSEKPDESTSGHADCFWNYPTRQNIRKFKKEKNLLRR